MPRGTTPTHVFELPVHASVVQNIRLIYQQHGKTLLRKEAADCKLEGFTVSIRLTQEETFLFDHNELYRVQMRVLTTEGDVYKSNVKIVMVSECLDDEEI